MPSTEPVTQLQIRAIETRSGLDFGGLVNFDPLANDENGGSGGLQFVLS